MPPAFSARNPWPTILKAFLIVLAVGYAFAPAISGDWLWDDNSEITTHLTLRDPAGWWKTWIQPEGPDYFPLKTTVQWVEWHLWRDRSTLGYHLVSLTLHLTSALLLWRLLRKLGLQYAWIGGLIFAVHPITVESVAWIAELKNTLSLPLLLLAASAYLDFDLHRKRADHLASLCWFIAAMLCKSSVVMFPLILLLYAWWKRRTVASSDILPVLPFFAISLVLGLITIWFQHHRAINGWDLPQTDLIGRAVTGGLSIVFYLYTCLWPWNTSPVYPEAIEAISRCGFLIWPALTALFWFAWVKRAKWGRAVIFGGSFFVINLLPVIGLVPMSYARISWVADHFAYLSWIGIAGLIAAAFDVIGQRLTSRAWPYVIGVVLCIALALKSHMYAKVFSNQESLWSFTLERNPTSWLAENNLGAVRLKQEKWSEAASHFERSLRFKPTYASAHVNWGNALLRLNQPEAALSHYAEALRLEPDSIEAHFNLANTLVQLGRVREALPHYEVALRLSPQSVDVHYNFANALVQSEQWSEAIRHYNDALRINPNLFEAHLNLGNLLAATGHPKESAAHFETAVKLAPTSVEARYSYADLLAQTGKLSDAVIHYTEALRLDPTRADIHTSFGNTLLTLRRPGEAIAHYQEALRLDPENREARANLTIAQRMQPSR